MPFHSEEIIERFTASRVSQRLGHAYLLTGSTEEAVEALGLKLATLMLGAETDQHPRLLLGAPGIEVAAHYDRADAQFGAFSLPETL